MANDKLNKMKEVADYIESGIEEFGRDENMRLEVTTIWKYKKTKVPEFAMVFLYFSDYASKHFKPVTCKLLFQIISMAQMQNFLTIDIQTFCEKLQMSRASVQRGLKELIENNIIIIVANRNDRRRNDYFINPLGVWRGNGHQRNQFIDKLKKEGNQLEIDLR